MTESQIEKYTRQIEALKESLTHKQAELSDVRRRYVVALPEYLQKEYDDRVSSAVRHHPEVAQALGTDGLRPMKAELCALKERVPEIVSTFVDQEKVWMPSFQIRAGDSIAPAHNASIEFKESIDKAMRQAIGQVGNIIIKYKFASGGSNSEWINDRGQGYTYRYGITLPPSLTTLSKQYEGLIYQYYQVQLDLVNAISLKNEAEAQDLWDQA